MYSNHLCKAIVFHSFAILPLLAPCTNSQIRPDQTETPPSRPATSHTESCMQNELVGAWMDAHALRTFAARHASSVIFYGEYPNRAVYLGLLACLLVCLGD
jgi:hypothetical protein